MTKQLALAISLLICLGHVTDHTSAQGILDQRVSELSKQISDGLTENQKRTIAVVEFGDLDGHVTTLGRFIAEELITRLYQTKKFKVIERQLLNKVIAEQKLSLTGVIEQSAAQRLGKVLGVDAIASGTVTDLGNSLRINARLIDTATGEIFAVASTEIGKDEAVQKLLGTNAEAPMNADNGTEQSAAVQRVDDLGFTFELQPCQMGRSMITCDLSIKNNRDDRGFTLEVDGSRLFDDLGNSFPAVIARLGTQSGGGPHIDLVSGVTIKARMTFQPLGSQASKIAMLQIHFTSFSDGRTIKFRNVPLRSEVLKSAPTAAHKTIVKDFVFEIASCKLSKGELICEPTVTNTSADDREVLISALGEDNSEMGKTTRALDEFGGEYTPAWINLGTVGGRKDRCDFGQCRLTNTLVPRAPMKISLSFAKVNPDAVEIALLRIYLILGNDPKGVRFSADLRNIPINK